MEIKIKTGLLFCSLLLANVILAQDFEALFSSALKNSPQLKALANYEKELEHQASTGIFPDDPSISYGYFPGFSGTTALKQTFGINQSIDFPTKYASRLKAKKRSAEQQKQLIAIERLKVVESIREVMIELVHSIKNENLLQKRVNALEKIYEASKTRFEQGDLDFLQFKKTEFELAQMKNELVLQGMQGKRLAKQFAFHLDSDSLDLRLVEFPKVLMPEKEVFFKQLIDAHPYQKLSIVSNDLAEIELKQSKQKWLPDFELGFEVEMAGNDQFRGLRAGINIPLWNNLNEVKLAKAKVQTEQSRNRSQTLELVNDYTSYYEQMLQLKKQIETYQTFLNSATYEEKLNKAFLLKELTVSEYFNQLQTVYEAEDELLMLEKSLCLIQNRLTSYTHL